jgi:hypothetical protein
MPLLSGEYSPGLGACREHSMPVRWAAGVYFPGSGFSSILPQFFPDLPSAPVTHCLHKSEGFSKVFGPLTRNSRRSHRASSNRTNAKMLFPKKERELQLFRVIHTQRIHSANHRQNSTFRVRDFRQGDSMSLLSSDIHGKTGVGFEFNISAASIARALLQVKGEPDVTLTVSGDGSVVEVPSLPAGRSFVQLDLVWAPEDDDAIIDVESGPVTAADPRHTLDAGKTPGFVELWGENAQ